uniref:Peptidase M23 n=1 Tax=Thermorudis peleae TaxID=1382356 RepID=A0A831X206_9BACT
MPIRFGIRSPQLGPSTGAAAQFLALLAERGLLDSARMASSTLSGLPASRPGGDVMAQLAGAWPARGEVTSHFGPRTLLPGEQHHSGIDIAVPIGTPVQATADGIVQFVGNTDGYGVRVEIRHADGTVTLYAHLSEALVQPGQRVVKGETIGKSGNTGASTGPHLHYEIRRNGQAVDPWPIMSAQPVPAPHVHSPASDHGTVSQLPYGSLIVAAGQRYGIDPALIAAIIQAESGFNPHAVSPAGAKGLMQLMDATAAGLGVSDPFDPAQNVDGGARYLRDMLARFGGDLRLALAAYNAGPLAVEQAGGVPDYPETQAYVSKVLATYQALLGLG